MNTAKTLQTFINGAPSDSIPFVGGQLTDAAHGWQGFAGEREASAIVATVLLEIRAGHICGAVRVAGGDKLSWVLK